MGMSREKRGEVIMRRLVIVHSAGRVMVEQPKSGTVRIVIASIVLFRVDQVLPESPVMGFHCCFRDSSQFQITFKCVEADSLHIGITDGSKMATGVPSEVIDQRFISLNRFGEGLHFEQNWCDTDLASPGNGALLYPRLR